MQTAQEAEYNSSERPLVFTVARKHGSGTQVHSQFPDSSNNMHKIILIQAYNAKNIYTANNASCMK